ncbi:MAG TPA: cyclic nucleotide-binding domain-containing protein [Acidimicrobiia bacterium]|jgi:CRP-like cAMP-binding protein
MLKRQADKIEYLKKVPLFAGMSKKDLTAVARAADETNLTSGEVIVFQDDSAPAAYILVSAEAIVRRNNRKVAELGPGDVIGELALISDAPRNATVVATKDGTVLEVPRRHFLGLIENSPALARRVMSQLADRLAEADRKLYG